MKATIEQVKEAGERYMKHLHVCYTMQHPKESPYTYIEVGTGAAGMVNEAWNNDAHLLARMFVGVEEISTHPSPFEILTGASSHE